MSCPPCKGKIIPSIVLTTNIKVTCLPFQLNQQSISTYLSFLLIEVVDNHTNEQVQSEERAEDDEDDKIKVHVQVNLLNGLLFYLSWGGGGKTCD